MATIQQHEAAHGVLVLDAQRPAEAQHPRDAQRPALFVTPHEPQVSLCVGDEAPVPYAAFAAQLGASPFYAFVPESLANDGAGSARRQFEGTLFHGRIEHEDGVLRVRPLETQPVRGELRYVCFGRRDAAPMAQVVIDA
jgi:hypothetical protein